MPSKKLKKWSVEKRSLFGFEKKVVKMIFFSKLLLVSKKRTAQRHPVVRGFLLKNYVHLGIQWMGPSTIVKLLVIQYYAHQIFTIIEFSYTPSKK